MLCVMKALYKSRLLSFFPHGCSNALLEWKSLHLKFNHTEIYPLSVVWLTISHHCFRWWFGAEQVTSHYLNQWWASLLGHICITHLNVLNTLRQRQNGGHFADDNFKHILLNENMWISNTFSLKFVPKGPINNIPALVQIMACRRPGDKPLSEPVMVKLLTHICITRPQWVNNIVIIPQKATMS